MKKIIFIILASISILSCTNTNREYCRACENEILKINKELCSSYEFYNQMYTVYIYWGSSGYETYKLIQIEEKIKELKNKRTYYELEIKKHSKKWEFDSHTLKSYNDLKEYDK